MKIYASSPNADRPKLAAFFKALEELEKKGHKVIDIYKNEAIPLPEDVDYQVKKFKESEKAIKEADVVVIDVTYPGRRIGFEVARALDEKKVVIALNNIVQGEDQPARRIPSFVGNTAKNFIYRDYNADNINSIMEEGLNIAKQQLDTKFILIISPEIDKYLEWVSQERRMHKAQVVRESIESQMIKDKEYQQFLKDL